MSDIFISYSKADHALALKLSAFLEAEGWSVWCERKRVESAVIPRMQQEITRGVGRNRAIAKARNAGATLRAIGNAVGISKEWVRQIAMREL